MKSGTSYLGKLLNSHPSVFMCEPDEPSYFVDPQQLKSIWPDMWRRGFWLGEEHYLKLFDAAAGAPIVGEASTNYSKLPMVTNVAEKIRAFNPDARLIYLLRDPVRRTISHYWHMVRHHAENRPMIEAIKRDTQFMDVSHYAMQLEAYLRHFPPDQIAILTHEHLIRDPAETMRALYAWLGIEPSAVDMSHFGQPENVTPETIAIRKYGAVSRRLLQKFPIGAIGPHIPQPFRRTLRRLTTRQVQRRSVDTTELVNFLRPIQLRQTEQLARLVGRTFPEWTTLSGRPGAWQSNQTPASTHSGPTDEDASEEAAQLPTSEAV